MSLKHIEYTMNVRAIVQSKLTTVRMPRTCMMTARGNGNTLHVTLLVNTPHRKIRRTATQMLPDDAQLSVAHHWQLVEYEVLDMNAYAMDRLSRVLVDVRVGFVPERAAIDGHECEVVG